MKNRGFTLIEIMIAIVIVGIIAAIAIPSYESSVRKSKRSDGKVALTDLQMNMEKFRGNCASYPDTIANADDCANGEINYSTSSTDGHYTISISAAGGNSYTLEADPTGTQAKDTSCDPIKITVNNANPKGLKEPADCW